MAWYSWSQEDPKARERNLWRPLLLGFFVLAIPLMDAAGSSPQEGLIATVELPQNEPALFDDPVGTRFGDCPDGLECTQSPRGNSFPPRAVTGHTVYAGWWVGEPAAMTDGAIPGISERIGPVDAGHDANVQRECLTWFNGGRLLQQPGPSNEGTGLAYPGDEAWAADSTNGHGPQDYSFNRDAPGCGHHHNGAALDEGTLGLPTDWAAVAGYFSSVEFDAEYIVLVEKGDCDPVNEGKDHRFRARLDFEDPNGLHHEVQEYDYVCPAGGPKNLVPAPGVPAFLLESAGLGDGDPHNEEGCTETRTGDKCVGSLHDLFTERLWITKVHEPVLDRTVERVYNFALQTDTCSGINIHELGGKRAMGPDNDYMDAHRLPDDNVTRWLLLYNEVAYFTYYSLGLDEFLEGWPLYDLCTDGSSFSFTGEPRGRVVHGGPPNGRGDEEIMRGNSYDFEPDSPTFGMHRADCRVQEFDWPLNTYPPGPPVSDIQCYVEDHKNGLVDLWAYPAVDHPLFKEFEERNQT